MARIWPWLGLLVVPLLACRGGGTELRTVATDAGTCVDEDNDGFGRNCSAGPDCDDEAADIHRGCTACTTPAAGCVCDSGTAPESCYLEVTEQAGELMCHEGTRYCRDGLWSDCEGVFSYVLPEERRAAALIDMDAGPTSCNACNPICYRVTDTLDPSEVDLTGLDTLAWSPSGGLTLAEDESETTSAPTPTNPATCVLGSSPDADCDGIPDGFDPYPSEPPFESNNVALFLEMGPGETDSGDVDIEFSLNTADVYFLVDQSASMQGERDRLVADITSGNFITDASYECADVDGDGLPNNELKTGGIIGAIRCIIRDSNFGVGLFRELPFEPTYAPRNQLPFEHFQDITGDGDAVRAAINRLWLEGNYEWPEVGAVALHSLVTGDGMYLGTQLPGVPSRRDCPEGRWGYACFRQSTVPIVMLFTDAMLHNGPPSLEQPVSNAYAYQGPFTIRTSGNADDADYLLTDQGNETLATAYDVGNVSGRLLTVQGNTDGMASNYQRSDLSCTDWDDDAPDAVVRFAVAETQQVSLSTVGSRFDTVLGLYNYQPPAAQTLAAADNTNETAGTARSFGSITGTSRRIDGNTSGMQANFVGSTVGCSADSRSPDAVYSFTASADTTVTLATAGSTLDSVVAIYDRPPLTTTYVANASNDNDVLGTAIDLGDIYNDVRAVSGNSAGAGIDADYSSEELGCSDAGGGSDVAYRFTLSQPTRVQLSTEGSTIDTRVALLGQACSGSTCSAVGGGVRAVPTSAESLIAAYDVGDLSASRVTLTGSTATMGSDVTALSCGAATDGADAVVRFRLNSTTDISMDASATGFDTVLGVFAADAAQVTGVSASGSNETAQSAQDLGTLNGKLVQVSGGSTLAMNSDYGAQQMSCASGTAGSGDAVYRFHLDSPTRVRLDTVGSAFDTVLSLHDAAIEMPSPSTLTTAPNNSERPLSAHQHGSVSTGFHRIDGDTTVMRPDVTFHSTASNSCHRGSDDLGRDAMVGFQVTQSGTYNFALQSSFTSGFALYPANIAPHRVPLVAYGNAGTGTSPSAVDLGDVTRWWVRGTGNSWLDAFALGSCSASSGRDTMFDFTLSQNRTVVLNSNGTAYNSALYLWEYTNGNHTSTSYYGCASTGGSGDDVSASVNLDSGDYLMGVTGQNSNEGGTYTIEIKDSGLGSDNIINCGGGSASNSLSQYLSAGTYYAVVKGYRAAEAGEFSLAISRSTEVFDPGDSHEVACNDEGSGLSGVSVIEETLPAGDYYVVVSGATAAAAGAYELTLQDMDDLPIAGEVGCADSGTLALSALPAGTYWAVVKGAGAADRGEFNVSLGASGAVSGAALACDSGTAGAPAGIVERDLAAGTYYAVVKGQTVAEAGDYRLSIRDVTNQRVLPIACDADSGSGESSFLQADVVAGTTYYVVVKGDAAADQASYQLTVTDQHASGSPVMLACDNDSGGSNNASALTRTLNPGVYYATVKGRRTSHRGFYQLTVGSASLQNGSYDPPTWDETEAELLSRGVKVIPILSCRNDPDHGDGGDCDQTRAQANHLANVTETLGDNLAPLVFDIDSNGSGLSGNVVDGIAELSNYLEMDVKVVIAWNPDQNPGFNATATPVNEAGDGCGGVSGDSHINCRPGATPKFEITFENPANAPVPYNPNDPKGGYNFKALLIGDNSFVMDEVPIYVIPENVEPDDGDPVYFSSGIYHQDMDSSGCTGNQRPDWRDLSWSAQVPRNTEVNFLACSGETSAELASCTLQSVVTVRGEGYCISDSDCSQGTCDPAVSACQVVSGGVCSGDAECASNASCQTGRCVYSSQPVYVGHELGADNYQSYLRLGIQLGGDAPILNPPVLSDWDLTYLCSDVN